jgi:hypothetical protein
MLGISSWQCIQKQQALLTFTELGSRKTIMKPITLLFVLCGAAFADNCGDDLDWCGWVLLRKGELQTIVISLDAFRYFVLADQNKQQFPCQATDNSTSLGDYYAYLVGLLQGMGKPYTDDVVKNSLWHCENDQYGSVTWIKYCGGEECQYGGNKGSNDHC